MEDEQAFLRKLTGRAFQPAGTACSTAQRPEIAIAIGICEQFGEAEALECVKHKARDEAGGAGRALGRPGGWTSFCVPGECP